jgi:hypothetical protein
MKTMAIIGIIVSAYLAIMCLTMITSEGMIGIFASYVFFLVFSILSLKNCK